MWCTRSSARAAPCMASAAKRLLLQTWSLRLSHGSRAGAAARPQPNPVSLNTTFLLRWLGVDSWVARKGWLCAPQHCEPVRSHHLCSCSQRCKERACCMQQGRGEGLNAGLTARLYQAALALRRLEWIPRGHRDLYLTSVRASTPQLFGGLNRQSAPCHTCMCSQTPCRLPQLRSWVQPCLVRAATCSAQVPPSRRHRRLWCTPSK
jgi:hypothetical protein